MVYHFNTASYEEAKADGVLWAQSQPKIYRARSRMASAIVSSGLTI